MGHGIKHGDDFPPYDWRRGFFDHDECTSTNGSLFSANNAGAAATVQLVNGEAGRPGIVELNTGSTTTGRAGWIVGGASSISTSMPTGIVEYMLEFNLRIPILSTVGEEFALRFGFGDTPGGDATDGVYFEYDRLTHSEDQWRAKSADNGTRTTVDTNTNIVADTWYRMKVIWISGLATFWVNDVQVAQITTNLPSTAARVSSPYITMIKSAGTTARTTHIDSIRTQIRGLAR